MHIKPQTLIVSIQCVAAEIKAIERQLEDGEPENAAELEQLLVAFDLAEDDLKTAYEEAQKKYGELPPYEELVKQFP